MSKIKTLKEWQPQAIDVRNSGKCPSCGCMSEVSYRLPIDDHTFQRRRKGLWYEGCGYYCEQCGWGTGGSRLVDPESPPQFDLSELGELYRAFLITQGYIQSLEPCRQCEFQLMLHVTHKPFGFGSDVTIALFQFECPECGYNFSETDSD